MNKQAYLEEAYNSAFNDELEKLSAPAKSISKSMMAEVKKRSAGRGKASFYKHLENVKAGKKESILNKVVRRIFSPPKGVVVD